MNILSLTIDNVGFDVMAMAEMTQDDFVKLHLENDAIARFKPEADRVKYLKSCYKEIIAAAKPAKAKEVPGSSSGDQ